MDRKGNFEIEKLETDPIFDRKQIEKLHFKYKIQNDFIPREVDKIYVSRFFGGYRNYDDKIIAERNYKKKKKKKRRI